MRSKILSLSLLFIGLVNLTSCSYFFGETEEKKNSYNLTVDEKTGVSCVKQNSDLLSDYFEMKRDDEQIAKQLRDMKGCIRDTVDLFVKHTKASKEEPDVYAAKDIHNFLRSIFDSYDFESQFMDDVFLLKASLLGGSQLRVTKAELRQLPDLVDFFYEGLAELAVERHLIFDADARANDWNRFEPAANKFLSVVGGVRKLNLKKSGDFDYQSLVRITMYFMEDPEKIEHWTKSFHLINSIQSLLSSGRHDHLDMTKFNFTVDNLSLLYLAYAEYNRYLLDEYFYKDMATIFTFPTLISRAVEDPSAYGGTKPIILNSVQKKIMRAMTAATDAGPSNKLSLDYIDDIITTLKLNKSLPEYINPDTLKGMFPQFFNVWLSPKTCEGDACFERFVNSSHVKELQRQLDNWMERQMWINTSLENKSFTRTSSQFKKRSQNANISSLQAAAAKVNHLHWSDKYLVVGAKEITFKDMVVLNDIYTLAELFLRPFNNNGQKKQLLNAYLDRAQALTFYQWFRPLGLELKMVDPRSNSTSTAAFTEINLFGSTAVEPDKMDMAELIEYFEIVISTSFRAVNLVNNEFVKCRIPRLFDVFGYEKMEARCFRQEWFEKHDQMLYSSLPRLQSYAKTLSDTEYKDMLNSLEKAGRQGLIVNEPFETDSFRQMTAIIQYAESMFNRFDANGSNVIEPLELRAALKHITPNITGIMKDSLDAKTVDLLYKAFPKFEEDLITYVIYKHELPGLLTSDTKAGALISLADMKFFKDWSNQKEKWIDEQSAVTRRDVLLVIAGLSSLYRVTKLKNLKGHFYKHELDFGNPLSGPKDPLLAPITKELGCSYKIEAEVNQWLVDNQKRYWNEALDWITPGTFVLFGWDFASLGISWDDIPEVNDIEIQGVPLLEDMKGTTSGWEGRVAYKLIELIAKDPKFGPLCGVPFIPGVHRIAVQQYYKQNMCQPGLVPLLPTIMPRCSDHYRKPY